MINEKELFDDFKSLVDNKIDKVFISSVQMKMLCESGDISRLYDFCKNNNITYVIDNITEDYIFEKETI